MRIGFLRTSDACYGTMPYFKQKIMEALRYWGMDAVEVDFTQLNGLADARIDALIMMNSVLPSEKLADGTYLLDHFPYPVFEILVDPPYYHSKVMENHSHNLHVILLDQGHVDYCMRYYPDFKSVNMSYLIGPVHEAIPYEEREIKVLFTGGCPDEDVERQRVVREYGDPWMVELFELLVERGISHPDNTTEENLKFFLRDKGLDATDQVIRTLMSTIGIRVEYYLRGYYRRKIVCGLVEAGIPVSVAGLCWEHCFPTVPANLSLLGAVDFSETALLTANAQISLNVMPLFKAGMHDRVLTAMHCGTVCVTDPSLYLEEHFTDGENIVFYRLDRLEQLPEQLWGLLEDASEAKDIAMAGYEKVREEYTWEQMVVGCILEKLI